MTSRPDSSASPPPTPDKPLRMDAQRNRDAIMAATRELIASHGPDVPMETIAASAGVGIGTMYRHFADRNALIRAISFDRLSYIRELATESKRTFADNPREAWDRFFDNFIASGLPMLLPSIIPFVAHNEVFDEQLIATRDRTIGFVAEIVDLARAEGFVRQDIALPEMVLFIAGAVRPIQGAPEELNARLIARRTPLIRAALAPSPETLPGEPVSLEAYFAIIGMSPPKSVIHNAIKMSKHAGQSLAKDEARGF